MVTTKPLLLLKLIVKDVVFQTQWQIAGKHIPQNEKVWHDVDHASLHFSFRVFLGGGMSRLASQIIKSNI